MKYSIKIKGLSESDTNDMALYLNEKGYKYEIKENVSECDWTDEDFLKRVPSAHFVATCGKESLNSRGMISKVDAYQLLQYYVKVHKLHEEDGIIYVNSWFQNLIQEFKPTISAKDLRKIVNKFFDY